MFKTFRSVRARSSRLIRPTIGSIISNGLTLYLDANDSTSYSGSGSIWNDLAGGDSDITLVNSPTYTSGSPAYFTFNGTTQYGTGNNNDVVPSTAYTKSVWFYLNGYNDNNLVSSGTGGHFLFMGSGTNKLYTGHANWTSLGGTYVDYPSTATISLNTWYHACVTFSTTNGFTLYINGVQDSTYTTRKNAHGGNGSTNIATFAGGNNLNGRISKVWCYNRELSSSEVAQNFNLHKALYGL